MFFLGEKGCDRTYGGILEPVMKDECVEMSEMSHILAFFSLIFFKLSTVCFAFMVSVVFHIIYYLFYSHWLPCRGSNEFVSPQNLSEDYIS